VGVPKDFYTQKPGKLGLQLLNTLVEQLEGTIKLDRSQGTTFKITFKELKYKKGMNLEKFIILKCFNHTYQIS